MKTVGIICEFNPFHLGHAYLIRKAREAGAENVICVMSDYFVQRGEAAILPASDRASVALNNGADAVFTLPFPYSASSAESFAEAGVFILSKLGCDTLVFGSETGDLSVLLELSAKEKSKPEKSQGTAAAYDKLAPNDILAVEYIRAAKRIKSGIGFYPVKRIGDGHDEHNSSETYHSSSFYRSLIRAGRFDELLPGSIAEPLLISCEAGICPVKNEFVEACIFSFFRLHDGASLSKYCECGGGVSELLCRSARNAGSYLEMMEQASTKKYTDARLRRAALFAYLGVKRSDLKAEPAYTRLVGFKREKAKEIGLLIKAGNISVVTNLRNIPGTPQAERQFELETRAEAIYTASLPKAAPCGTLLKVSAKPE